MSGTLGSFEHNMLVFDSAAAGTVRISRGQIAAITTDDIVTIILIDQSTLTGRLVRVSEDSMRITGPYIDGTPEFGIADIRTILPGTETGIRWRGRVNVGAGLSTGNTERHNVHVDAEAIGRTEKDRITGFFAFNWAEEDGDESANNALLSLKYDRFVTERWYLYAYTSFERDRMKDLRLRTTVGPGVGHQILDTPTANLHIEGGPTYLNSNHRVAEDESSIAGRWATSSILRYGITTLSSFTITRVHYGPAEAQELLYPHPYRPAHADSRRTECDHAGERRLR